MYSIAFPNMFNYGKTYLINDNEATRSNLKLLLKSNKGSLLGDPNFGSRLKELLYENNSPILRDLIIDDIYTTIKTYMPWISIKRKNIHLIQDKLNVYVSLTYTDLMNHATDTYNILLMTGQVS